MLKIAFTALLGLMIFAGAQVAQAGCMPCGHKKFCCNEDSCRRCNAESNEDDTGGITLLLQLQKPAEAVSMQFITANANSASVVCGANN